jgi:hypothetical protein
MAGGGWHVFRFGDDCHENCRENHEGHRDNYREKSGLNAHFLRLVQPSTWGLEALNIYYAGMALNVSWFKRKPPARRGVFSLEPAVFRDWDEFKDRGLFYWRPEKL